MRVCIDALSVWSPQLKCIGATHERREIVNATRLKGHVTENDSKRAIPAYSRAKKANGTKVLFI